MKNNVNGYTNGSDKIGRTNGKGFKAVSLTGTRDDNKPEGKVAAKQKQNEELEEYRNNGILLLALSIIMFIVTYWTLPKIALVYVLLAIIGASVIGYFQCRIKTIGSVPHAKKTLATSMDKRDASKSLTAPHGSDSNTGAEGTTRRHLSD